MNSERYESLRLSLHEVASLQHLAACSSKLGDIRLPNSATRKEAFLGAFVRGEGVPGELAGHMLRLKPTLRGLAARMAPKEPSDPTTQRCLQACDVATMAALLAHQGLLDEASTYADVVAALAGGVDDASGASLPLLPPALAHIPTMVASARRKLVEQAKSDAKVLADAAEAELQAAASEAPATASHDGSVQESKAAQQQDDGVTPKRVQKARSHARRTAFRQLARAASLRALYLTFSVAPRCRTVAQRLQRAPPALSRAQSTGGVGDAGEVSASGTGTVGRTPRPLLRARSMDSGVQSRNRATASTRRSLPGVWAQGGFCKRIITLRTLPEPAPAMGFATLSVIFVMF